MTIPVERVSKYIRADAILDIAFDCGLERPKVVAVNGWDESRKFMLTASHQGKTFTIAIDPILKPEAVKERIEQHMFCMGDQWTKDQLAVIGRKPQRRRKSV